MAVNGKVKLFRYHHFSKYLFIFLRRK